MEAADTSTPDTTTATPPAPEAATPPPAPPAASEPSAPGAAAATEKAPDPKDRAGVIRAALKAQAAPVEGKSLRDQMIEKGVIKPAGERPRAPDGKFTANAVATPLPAKAPALAPGIAGGPAPAKPQAIPLPKALKAELAEHWGKTPAEVQAAVDKYVKDASKGIENYKGRAEVGDKMLAEFKPYEAILRAEGGTPETALRQFLNTAYMLRQGTQAQKADLVARTMQAYGIAPEHVAAALQGAPQAGIAPENPMLAQLAAQVQSLSQALNGQQERSYTAIADNFGRDKPHWDLLKPHVAAVLARGGVEGADAMSEVEILNAAYTQVLQQYPVMMQQDAEAQKAAALKAERDKANAAAQAARAASVQVTGAPGAAAAPAFDPKDRRSVLAHALRTAAR